MIIIVSILCTALAVFLILLRTISQNRVTKISSLETTRLALQTKYEELIKQKRELGKEIKDKKRQMATLRNKDQGIKTISSKDLDIKDVDENEKVSRYLIQEGKITLEQNEKVLQKMDIIQMDYLGVCLTLGYIDIDTAKRAIKINKISTKSADLQ